MYKSDIIILEGVKQTSCIKLNRKKVHQTHYLNLTLTLLDIEVNTQTKFAGQIEFVHLFPYGKRRTRRCWIDQSHFMKDFPYSIQICTGDLLDRIRLTFYYDLPEVGLLEAVLSEAQPPNADRLVKAALLPEDPLEFLDAIRSLDTRNFQLWLTSELHALEAPSTKGSAEAFKKWAICDKIIQLWARGEIDAKILDWSVQNFSKEYYEVKEELGLIK